MLRQVDDGGAIGGGGEVDAQAAVEGQGVDDAGVERTGIAVLAVGRSIAHQERRLGRPGVDLTAPDRAREPARAAVQMMAAMVERERVLAAVEREARTRDAVRDPADDAPEVVAVLEVALEPIEAEHHVDTASAAVGHLELDQSRPQLADHRHQARRTHQREERHSFCYRYDIEPRIDQPPSINSVWPRICSLRAESRNTTAFAMSSGVAMRPDGVTAAHRDA